MFRADDVRLAWAAEAGETIPMERSCPEGIHVPEDSLTRGGAAAMGALERAARIADVKDRMATCLEELDRLQLAYAANHLCHAIEIIDDNI